MIERTSGAEDAVLVGLDLGQRGYSEGLEELGQLAASAGIRARAIVRGRRDRPDPAHFAGSGKVEEIKRVVQEHGASLAIFNHALSPVQERNLEKALGVHVVDRTRLILDIFAQRAQSHEGKLQVELAQLEHASTRLIRGWTHLERQRGRAFTVSLVGYTNAGKSTLFNALTHAGALAEDRLFATLDTTTRRLYLPEAGNVAISDTVGFIRDLPHTLVDAFRATLEEAIHADLLVHVVDASSESREAQIEEVDKVLVEIGAGSIPRVLAWNKIDRNGLGAGIDRDEYARILRVRLSAKTGDGVDGLRRALIEAAASKTSPASPPNSKEVQRQAAEA